MTTMDLLMIPGSEGPVDFKKMSKDMNRLRLTKIIAFNRTVAGIKVSHNLDYRAFGSTAENPCV